MDHDGRDNEATVLCRFDSYTEADLLARVLRDEGIPAAFLNDGPSAGITGTRCLGDGIDRAPWACWAVLVPASRREEAARIAEDWKAGAPVLPEEGGG